MKHKGDKGIRSTQLLEVPNGIRVVRVLIEIIRQRTETEDRAVYLVL